MAARVKIQRRRGTFGQIGSSNDFKEGKIFGKIMPWFSVVVSVCVCEIRE